MRTMCLAQINSPFRETPLRFAQSFCLFAGLLASALPSHAADTEALVFRAGAGIGNAKHPPEPYDNGRWPAFDLHAGYAFNANISVEAFTRSLRYEILKPLFGEITGGYPGDTTYYPKTHLGFAVLASVPLTERIRAYGRLGLGRTTMDADSEALSHYRITEPSAGLGLGLHLGRRLVLKLEATRFTKSKVNTNLLSFDLQF